MFLNKELEYAMTYNDWKCTDVVMRDDVAPCEDWEWRRKYIGLVGRFYLSALLQWPDDVVVIFANEDRKSGFRTVACEIVMDEAGHLKMTTDHSIYIFEKV